MCKIKKNIDVQVIKERLQNLAQIFGAESDEPVNATLVMDETYTSMTALVGGKVLCINFMQ